VGLGSVALASLRHKGGNVCSPQTLVTNVSFIAEFGWQLHAVSRIVNAERVSCIPQTAL